MKINEITATKPRGPMTPAQARIQTYKNQVKTAQDALKRERKAQQRQKAYKRIQGAQRALRN